MDHTTHEPGLKRHGYWDHPDPEMEIRGLLKGRHRLLKSFEEALAREEEYDGGEVLAWAESPGVPAEAQEVVRRAYEESHRFDEVTIAEGTETGGGMMGFSCRLTALRRGGLIHYRSRGEDWIPVPEPTRVPLAMEVLERMFVGDHASWESRLRGLDDDEIEAATSETGVGSDFYDLRGAQEDILTVVDESVREERQDPSADPAQPLEKGAKPRARTKPPARRRRRGR